MRVYPYLFLLFILTYASAYTIDAFPTKDLNGITVSAYPLEPCHDEGEYWVCTFYAKGKDWRISAPEIKPDTIEWTKEKQTERVETKLIYTTSTKVDKVDDEGNIIKADAVEIKDAAISQEFTYTTKTKKEYDKQGRTILPSKNEFGFWLNGMVRPRPRLLRSIEQRKRELHHDSRLRVVRNRLLNQRIEHNL